MNGMDKMHAETALDRSINGPGSGKTGLNDKIFDFFTFLQRLHLLDNRTENRFQKCALVFEI